MRSRSTRLGDSIGVVMIAVCLCALALGACGRKAPPVPPRRPPLPQPTALEGTRDGDTVRLTWQQGRHGQGVVRYAVMRARWPVEEPPCDGCPLIFEEVGSVTVEPAMEEIEFEEPVAADMVYSYKVVPVGSSGERGTASNRIVLPPEKAKE
jgi:hypothetical protein